MNAWRFKYGPKSLRVELDAVFIPGIRCDSCKQTWSAISRGYACINDAAKRLIENARPPLLPTEFDGLIKSLVAITQDASWYQQDPGSIAGNIQIRSERSVSGYRLLKSIYGPVFLSFEVASRILELCPQSEDKVRWLKGNKYAELVTNKVDLKEFGAEKRCDVCGWLDDSTVSGNAIAEYVGKAPPLSFFQLPYGPAFGSETKLVLEHVLSRQEVEFVPWEWPE